MCRPQECERLRQRHRCLPANVAGFQIDTDQIFRRAKAIKISAHRNGAREIDLHVLIRPRGLGFDGEDLDVVVAFARDRHALADLEIDRSLDAEAGSSSDLVELVACGACIFLALLLSVFY